MKTKGYSFLLLSILSSAACTNHSPPSAVDITDSVQNEAQVVTIIPELEREYQSKCPDTNFTDRHCRDISGMLSVGYFVTENYRSASSYLRSYERYSSNIIDWMSLECLIMTGFSHYDSCAMQFIALDKLSSNAAKDLVYPVFLESPLMLLPDRQIDKNDARNHRQLLRTYDPDFFISSVEKYFGTEEALYARRFYHDVLLPIGEAQSLIHGKTYGQLSASEIDWENPTIEMESSTLNYHAKTYALYQNAIEHMKKTGFPEVYLVALEKLAELYSPK